MMDRRLPHVLDTSSLLESFLQDDIKKQQQIKLPKRATETKGLTRVAEKVSDRDHWTQTMADLTDLLKSIGRRNNVLTNVKAACFQMEMTWNIFHLWKGQLSFMKKHSRICSKMLKSKEGKSCWHKSGFLPNAVQSWTEFPENQLNQIKVDVFLSIQTTEL